MTARRRVSARYHGAILRPSCALREALTCGAAEALRQPSRNRKFWGTAVIGGHLSTSVPAQAGFGSIAVPCDLTADTSRIIPGGSALGITRSPVRALQPFTHSHKAGRRMRSRRCGGPRQTDLQGGQSAMSTITPDDPLPRPTARRLPEDRIARWTAQGWHCEARKCRQPVAIVTWRRYRWHGQVRVAENFVCTEHGEAFSSRYGIEIASGASETEES